LSQEPYDEEIGLHRSSTHILKVERRKALISLEVTIKNDTCTYILEKHIE